VPLNPDSSLAPLFNAPINPGRVTWIGVRVARHAPLIVVESVEARSGKGLHGERYQKDGARQVTLIQAEHMLAIASYLRYEKIDPAHLRRNIVVEGINLLALKGKRFHVGSALLEYTGECHPCSRMEENLGTGGYNAMRGHGGITARVIDSGFITLGDSISVEQVHPAMPQKSRLISR
jgi:MOSC domain-containing protein YiiM